LVDLNCACPAKKVLKKHAGAYLLKEPKMAAKLIKKLSSSLPLPITVKVRSGWGKNGKEGLKLAKIAQENGASAIFIHGRTVYQQYSGKVDYGAIFEAKEALDIPIIASGDIFSPKLAKDMFEKTGCDGILIARGGFGRPWIFAEIEAYLKGKPYPSVSLSEIKLILKRHLGLFKKYKDLPDKHIIGQLRKIAIWYFKGIPYATDIRACITKAVSYKQVLEIIDRVKP
jgi:tRNA-dihydrouridine synthase B